MFFIKKKFDNEEKACMTCQYSRIENGVYYCKYSKAPVNKFHSCRRYLYDITKKVPKGINPNKIAEISSDIGDLLD